MSKDPITAVIIGQPGMSARLLAQHVDDGRGRCKVCSAGAQTGNVQFPCTLALAAQRARTLEQAARPQRRRP